MTETEWLTVAQAARRLGITDAALRRRIERGVIASSLKGKRRMLPASAVEYATDGEQGATGMWSNVRSGDYVRDPVAPDESGSVELVRELGKAIESLVGETEKRVNAERDRDAANERARQDVAARIAAEAEIVELRARVMQLESPGIVSTKLTGTDEVPSRSWWQRIIGGAE